MKALIVEFVSTFPTCQRIKATFRRKRSAVYSAGSFVLVGIKCTSVSVHNCQHRVEDAAFVSYVRKFNNPIHAKRLPLPVRIECASISFLFIPDTFACTCLGMKIIIIRKVQKVHKKTRKRDPIFASLSLSLPLQKIRKRHKVVNMKWPFQGPPITTVAK